MFCLSLALALPLAAETVLNPMTSSATAIASPWRAMPKNGRKDVVFVNGRAISLSLSEFDKFYAAEIKRLKHARIIVSYCHGEGCRLSDSLPGPKLV